MRFYLHTVFDLSSSIHYFSLNLICFICITFWLIKWTIHLMEEHRRITESFEEQGIFSTLPGILMFMCQRNRDKLVNDETAGVTQQDKPCFFCFYWLPQLFLSNSWSKLLIYEFTLQSTIFCLFLSSWDVSFLWILEWNAYVCACLLFTRPTVDEHVEVICQLV